MSLNDTNHLIGNGNGGAYAEDDMFDLGGFVHIFTGAIKHNVLLILVTCGLTLLAATVYVVVWPPVYEVKAQVMAERDLDPSRDVFYSNWQIFRKADASDEIVLFTSGPVLRKVIQEKGLTYRDVYHTFLGHVSWLWYKSWPGRAYRSVKNFVFPDPYAVEGKKELEDLGRTVDGLKAGIKIAGEQDSYIATITGRGPTPAIAGVTNATIDAYLAYRKEMAAKEARTAYEALDEEATRARQELDTIIAQREAFAAQHQLLVKFQKQAQDVSQLTNVETHASEIRAQVASLQASLQEVERQLASESPNVVLSSVRQLNSVRENAKLHRLDLQSSLIDLRQRYRDDSPEVRNAEAELEKVEALIASEPEYVEHSVTEGVNSNYQNLIESRDQLRSSLKGAQAQLAATEETAGDMQGRLASLPSVMEQSTNLDRAYEVASDKYKQLLLRRNEAQVSAAASAAAPQSVRVIDYARPPTSKHWPKLKYLYPGALLIGLALGIVAALLRTLTAGRLQRSHLERGRLGAPVLGTIYVGDRVPALSLANGYGHQLHALPAPSAEDEGGGSTGPGA